MENSSPLSPPKSHCGNDADDIIDAHLEQIIPLAGAVITLPVNFVIVQDLNGDKNFDLNNSEHINFLNDIADKMNGRMDNLVPETCSCSVAPTFYGNTRIQYDVNLIEMRTAIWDHEVNDPTPRLDISCSVTDHYAYDLNAEFIQDPDYSEAITFFFTDNESDTNVYAKRWYSGTRCENDLSHPALIHAPDAIEDYIYLDSGLGNPDQSLETLSNFYGRTAAHEIFHQFQLGQGHKDACAINIMNSTGRFGTPAPNPNNPETAITGCQLRQTYGTLMAHHMAKYVPCIQSYDQEIEITTNETWDRSTKIFSNVRVMSGASLTIECHIEMQQDGKIFVEEGGRLIVDGGEITSCGTWYGIQVQGSMEGYSVEIINGAVIENANRAAVSMFHESGWLLGGGNARILIDEATFINCDRMLAMGAWPRQWNQSIIRKSTQENGRWGITNWNCMGVTVDDNIFNKQLKVCVNTIDGSYQSITDNEFYSQDIDVLLINTAILESSNIKENDFNGANTGLHIVGGSIGFMDIEDNEFNNDVFGCFFDDHSAYNLEENEFNSDFGAISASNGGAGNRVSENEFYDNAIGIYPFFDNSGYNFTFNCFETGLVDANIDDEIFDAIRSSNGAAGNCFTHGGTLGAALDIDGNMSHFTYFEPSDSEEDCHDVLSSNTGFSVEPDEIAYSGCATGIGTGGNGGFNPCATHETEEERLQAEQILLAKIAWVQQNPYLTRWQKIRLVAVYNRCLQRLKRKRAEEEVKEGDFTSAIALYVGSDTLTEEKLTLYGILLSSGDYAGARNYMNNIPSGEDEKLMDFKTVQNINIDRFENEEYEPSEAVLALLQDVAYKHHTYSAYAKALLYLFTGELIITPLPEYNPQIEGRSDTYKSANDAEIVVYPNPLSDILIIKNVNYNNASLSINSLSGHLLLSKNNIVNSEKVDITMLDSGVYFLLIYEGENLIHKEKLVVIK